MTGGRGGGGRISGQLKAAIGELTTRPVPPRLVSRRHYRHQNDSCIKMGSDESHFNASLIVTEGQSQKTVSTLTSDPQPFQRKAAESRHIALLIVPL